jgi:uncharacterized protein (DUF2126 family)
MAQIQVTAYVTFWQYAPLKSFLFDQYFVGPTIQLHDLHIFIMPVEY